MLGEEDLQSSAEAVREWVEEPSLPADGMFPHPTRKNDAIAGLTTILVTYAFAHKLIAAVWTKVETMETSGNGDGFVLFAGLARAFPDRAAELAQRLRRGLVADDPDVSGNAGAALYHWLKAAEEEPSLPRVADDLVQEIGTAVAARRRGTLQVALELSCWLLDEGPVRYRSLVKEGCEHGLSYLVEELAYSATTAREAVGDLDVPLLRKKCARLAVAMDRAGYGTGRGVRAWIEAAATDPLPEVRNVVRGALE